MIYFRKQPFSTHFFNEV
ncbi:hypothetical protein D018_1076A, partial [Vibrio parahaemolyticus VP2007-007]